MTTLAKTALAIALTGALATPAIAQNCAPRERVLERLAQSYGETRQSVGLGANNAMVEVYASQDSGTWTIIVTTAEGLTCLVASGQAFETLAEALPAKGKDA